jgi:hypothetical protein
VTEQITQRRYDTLYQAKMPAITQLPGASGSRDGDTIRYKALASYTGALSDVWWTFTFDAAAAYWYLTGGSPLVTYAVSGAGETTVSSSYVTPTTTTTVVLPFPGDYLVALAAVMSNNTIGDGVAVSYDIGATAASNAWAVFNTAVAGVGDAEYGRAYYLHTGVLSGDQIVVKHQRFTGGTAASAHRQLNVLPLRVH